jgi:hypothetical protein
MLPMAITPWHLAIVISCIACAGVSLMVIYWFRRPDRRRQNWVRWFAVAL